MKGKGVILKGDHYEKVLSVNEKKFYDAVQGHNITPPFTIEKREEEFILKIEAYAMTLAYYMDINEVDNIDTLGGIKTQVEQLIDKLHSINIVHIDLSPYNIVVNPTEDFYDVKFIDFELSRFIDSLCEEDFDDFKTFLPFFNPRRDTLENSIQDLLKYEHKMWKIDYI
jgi:tRNA A-37 threonylcarbamoyl transferase component Bud32